MNTYLYRFINLKYFFCALFFSFWILNESIAQDDLSLVGLEFDITNSYNLLLAEKVTDDLRAYHKIFADYPNKYWQFLNETFLDNWDFDATTKALIGSEIFNLLSHLQFTELSRALEVTLVRYAFESLSFYSGQKLNVIDAKLNEQKTLAWLKINMESSRLPDIHLDLLLKRTIDDKWKGVDFRFKGITYVNLKKNSYRQDFKNLKFRGLIRTLENKNRLFFEDLCESDANYLDPLKPPCL